MDSISEEEKLYLEQLREFLEKFPGYDALEKESISKSYQQMLKTSDFLKQELEK